MKIIYCIIYTLTILHVRKNIALKTLIFMLFKVLYGFCGYPFGFLHICNIFPQLNHIHLEKQVAMYKLQPQSEDFL